jgi:hypothetical protein
VIPEIAGAVYGIEAIPSRWASMVHGEVATPTGVALHDIATLHIVGDRLLPR